MGFRAVCTVDRLGLTGVLQDNLGSGLDDQCAHLLGELLLGRKPGANWLAGDGALLCRAHVPNGVLWSSSGLYGCSVLVHADAAFVSMFV